MQPSSSRGSTVNQRVAEIRQFTEKIKEEKVEPSAIEAYANKCLQELPKGNAQIATALDQMAIAINQAHPKLSLLVKKIFDFAVAHPALPRDIERLLLSSAQQRLMNKARRDQIDREASDKLLKLEPLLPEGYFPAIERIEGKIVNPLKQLNEITRIILSAAKHEPQFESHVKILESLGLSVHDPPALAALARWVAKLNLDRFLFKAPNDKTIKKLKLDQANLTLLPPQIWSYKAVRDLRLNQNPLLFIPREIFLMSNLLSLNCANTLIQDLPKQLKYLSLEVLDISDTKFKRLPPSLFEISSLKVLALNGLKLMTLPGEIGQLLKLEHLEVERNKLLLLPYQLLNLRIKTLNISDNSFQKPPMILEEFDYLTTLYCRGLKMEEVKNLVDFEVVVITE